MNAADRARGERAIFRIFAEAAALPVKRNSIRSRPVPEPDIRCTVDGKSVAFELGEVVNPALAEMTNQSHQLRRRFAAAYDELPGAVRACIESRLGGPPAVFAAFSVPPGKWRQAIPPMIAVLVERANLLVHHHEIPVWQIPTLRQLVLEMKVQRASGRRAGLYASEMTEVVDRTQTLLTQKFARSYRTSAPIELVGYYASQPPRRDDGWLEALVSFITQHLDASPVRRVWLFDNFSKTVLAVVPQP
jgi:hypothetical protein